MCGITGYWDLNGNLQNELALKTVKPMTDALRNRGPDSEGVWVDHEAGVVLGHRRLAIIDLSPAGHQPMLSASGRYSISINCEIYNFQDLRSELSSEGKLPALKGTSDTEILVAAIEAWGLEKAVKKSNGMFAFALWDREEKKLHLVRDRLGKKPLYFGKLPSRKVVFGSELKAIREFSGFSPEIDQASLANFIGFGYIPAPYSIYKSINKVRPGTIVSIDKNGTLSENQYWDVRSAVESGQGSVWKKGEVEASKFLETLLDDAIKIRMISDVPLGAFLSGGIDSTTVVALMQHQSPRPIKTFTIGFNEATHNEAKYAKEIAKHLGTDHTEHYLSPAEALDVIPSLPKIYDEPFADSSQIPTYLVSKLAKSEVTVVLSGDGGDEFFAGYTRYIMAQKLWKKMSRTPKPMRQAAAYGMKALSPDALTQIFGVLQKVSPNRLKFSLPGDKIHKLADTLTATSPDELYLNLVSMWRNPELILRSGERGHTLPYKDHSNEMGLSFVDSMMYQDMMTYLPDDILVKVDRANMAVSLEGRAPLLDYRILEFAWQLPLEFKLKNGIGKLPIRSILDRYVPKALIERPKMGFAVPIDSWLRGPLRNWAQDLLSPASLDKHGFFNPEPIQLKWKEHLSGKRNWQYYLWNILMFQAWYRENF